MGNDTFDSNDASVRSGVADSFDMYGCSDASNDGADMSMCDSWRLLHLTEASDPFRRYDEWPINIHFAPFVAIRACRVAS